MVELKSLDIKSVAIISIILFSILGLLAAIPIGLLSFMASSLTGAQGVGFFSGIAGLFLIIILPIFYGAIGTLVNVIIAFAYNLIAERVGGLKFRLVNLKTNVNRFAEVKPVQEINLDDELNKLS